MSMNILFVGHEATRTGAPILLLNFIKWLKENRNWNCQLLLCRGGDLVNDYNALLPTAILASQESGNRKVRLFDRLRGHKLSTPVQSMLEGFTPDLIYCNTLAVGQHLKNFTEFNAPLLLHVHELNFFLETISYCEEVATLVSKANQIIAASAAVERFVKESFEVEANRVERICEFIPSIDNQSKHDVSSIKAELGIPQDSKVIVCCGTLDWRKGSDLAVQLLTQVRAVSQKNVHLVWVGVEQGSHTAKQLVFDATKTGVVGALHLVESTPDALPYLAIGDVFALLSKEDPYPVAMLEAASLGKPIVCFDGSGGATDFVGETGGVAVPYLDVSQMSRTIVELFDSPEQVQLLGENARSKAKLHQIDLVAPLIIHAIEETVAKHRTG